MKKIRKIIALLVFLLLWLIVSYFHLVKPIFLPPLSEVMFSLKSILFSIEGLKNILFTVKRAMIAFIIGITIAIPLGILLGSYKNIYEYFEWFIDFFRSVPITAMFPLFLVFFGFGDKSKIAMAAWAAGFTILISTIHGVWSTKENRRIMALTKRATRYQILTKITLPETLPFIFAGMRTGISWTLIAAIIAEMFIGTKYGMGHIIYDASIVFDTSGVIAGIIIIGSIGLIANNLIVFIEKKVVHWKGV